MQSGGLGVNVINAIHAHFILGFGFIYNELLHFRYVASHL